LGRVGRPVDDGDFLAWSVSRYVTQYNGTAPRGITLGRVTGALRLLEHLRVPYEPPPINIGEKSGQLRPYVRPVARRMPLAIMGVRFRVRHQSGQRAQGTTFDPVLPELP